MKIGQLLDLGICGKYNPYKYGKMDWKVDFGLKTRPKDLEMFFNFKVSHFGWPTRGIPVAQHQPNVILWLSNICSLVRKIFGHHLTIAMHNCCESEKVWNHVMADHVIPCDFLHLISVRFEDCFLHVICSLFTWALKVKENSYDISAWFQECFSTWFIHLFTTTWNTCRKKSWFQHGCYITVDGSINLYGIHEKSVFYMMVSPGCNL